MKKRMVYQEQRAFINLQGAVNLAKAQEEDLSHRINSIPGAKRYLHSGIGMLNKVIELLNDTVPQEQQDHFRMQKATLKMIVGIKAQMPRDKNAEFGRWLSFNLLDIVADAIKECCCTCTIGDPQQQKQCKYARLLEVLPTDKPDENAPGCGYFAIWGGF